MNAPKVHEEIIGLTLLFASTIDTNVTETHIQTVLAQYCPTIMGLLNHKHWSKLLADDWQDKWKQFWKPERILPHLIVCPTWECVEDVLLVHTKDIVLQLDPGMAFGTGSHETTRLVLKMMSDYRLRPNISCQMKNPIKTMLDVGTGSGILAIYGAKLGLEKVIGIDNDPLAETIAIENARQNQLNPQSATLWFETDTLESWQAKQNGLEQYDLVTANIILQVILPLLPLLIQSTKPGGLLMLSGILKSQFESVKVNILQYDSDLEWVTMYQYGEWLGIVYRRKTTFIP